MKGASEQSCIHVAYISITGGDTQNDWDFELCSSDITKIHNNFRKLHLLLYSGERKNASSVGSLNKKLISITQPG
jgi:hypothetical protein